MSLVRLVVCAVPDLVEHVLATGAVRQVDEATVGRVAVAVADLQPIGARTDESKGDEDMHALLLAPVVVEVDERVTVATINRLEDAPGYRAAEPVASR